MPQEEAWDGRESQLSAVSHSLAALPVGPGQVLPSAEVKGLTPHFPQLHGCQGQWVDEEEKDFKGEGPKQ